VQSWLALSKPTTHRLLAALVSHGLVAQDAHTRRYALGPAIAALQAGKTQARVNLAQLSMYSVYRLAEESQDTVFLVGREQLDTVCLARESGSYPIRAITVEVGTRRPLGVGAGGISILGSLQAAEAQRIVTSLARRLAAQPRTSAEHVLRGSEQARRKGYAVSDEQVAKGVRGVSISVRDLRGDPVAAIGIAAISERLAPSRIPRIVEMLLRERSVIEAELLRPSGP
jgi:DNA-binding IclR family transcriptional regulator